MSEIVLTNGLVAIVDEEDHARIAAHTWYAQRNWVGCSYAFRYRRDDGKDRKTYMAREILCVTSMSVEVDHINGNTLDNRRANLRQCSRSENGRNKHRRKTGFSSQFKGVTWYKARSLWAAQIKVNRKNVYLGYFIDERTAAEAYNAAALRLHGAFACLNRL